MTSHLTQSKCQKLTVANQMLEQGPQACSLTSPLHLLSSQSGTFFSQMPPDLLLTFFRALLKCQVSMRPCLMTQFKTIVSLSPHLNGYLLCYFPQSSLIFISVDIFITMIFLSEYKPQKTGIFFFLMFIFSFFFFICSEFCHTLK